MTTPAAGGVTLRELVRREVVARQLAPHLPAPPARVLDVGGDPATAIGLARAGSEVVLVSPDDAARAAAAQTWAAEPQPVRSRVEVRVGPLGGLARVVQEKYDVVLCHHALRRHDPGAATAPRAAVLALSDLVAPGGVVSLVALNADGMGLAPALEGRWADALDLLLAVGEAEPVVVHAADGPVRAHRIEELAAWVSGRRMHVESWFGVGLLTAARGDQPAPADADERAAVLAAEELAGRTDPYRRVAPLLHVVGRRGTD